MKKKKILLFSDDMRMSSGVGTMSREMIVGTAHHFDWVQVGGAIKHPEQGQTFDLSKQIYLTNLPRIDRRHTSNRHYANENE